MTIFPKDEVMDDESIICPYCGHEHIDMSASPEGEEDDGQIVCEKCKRMFAWQRIVQIEYRTWQLSDAEGK